MKKLLIIFLYCFVLNSIQRLSGQEINSLRSPNEKLKLTIQMSKEGQLSYSFIALNRQMINNSPLGYSIGQNKKSPPQDGM